MARFDVYANPGKAGYVLDVQADLLSALNTRIVVPLMPAHAAPSDFTSRRAAAFSDSICTSSMSSPSARHWTSSAAVIIRASPCP